MAPSLVMLTMLMMMKMTMLLKMMSLMSTYHGIPGVECDDEYFSIQEGKCTNYFIISFHPTAKIPTTPPTLVTKNPDDEFGFGGL